jgi:hypothetical protein
VYFFLFSIAPDPPLKPEIISVQTRTADVLWQKPRSNGSDILQYTLKWYQKKNIEFYDEETKQKDQEDENEKRIVLLSRTITSTKYTLSGLTPGKELIVQISASNLIANKICDSAFSIPSDPVKTLPDVPFTPEQPSLTNASSHTIDVEFVEPYHNGYVLLYAPCVNAKKKMFC